MPERKKFREEGALAKRVKWGSLLFALAMILVADFTVNSWVNVVALVLAVIAAITYIVAAVIYGGKQPIEPNDRSHH